MKLFRNLKGFLKLLVSATSQESSKRFVVVFTILIFLILNTVFIIVFCLIFIKLLPVNELFVADFFTTLRQIIEADVALIMFGIGATVATSVADRLGNAFSNKWRSKAGTPDTVVNVEQNDTIKTSSESG